jgi:SAM-dependent methyltransferase
VQADLFGEPARDPALSQWFTPMWLARKLALWVPEHARVLEPACGIGNLLYPLYTRGHSLDLMTGVDISASFVAAARARLAEEVLVVCGDFFEMPLAGQYDVVLMNPPFEANAHLRFVMRALCLAPVVVGIFPSSFEFSVERDRELWATRAVVTNRARLPERVDYGGDQSPSFDSVALRITRRSKPREPGERLAVYEEVWRP